MDYVFKSFYVFWVECNREKFKWVFVSWNCVVYHIALSLGQPETQKMVLSRALDKKHRARHAAVVLSLALGQSQTCCPWNQSNTHTDIGMGLYNSTSCKQNLCKTQSNWCLYDLFTCVTGSHWCYQRSCQIGRQAMQTWCSVEKTVWNYQW